LAVNVERVQFVRYAEGYRVTILAIAQMLALWLAVPEIVPAISETTSSVSIQLVECDLVARQEDLSIAITRAIQQRRTVPVCSGWLP